MRRRAKLLSLVFAPILGIIVAEIALRQRTPAPSEDRGGPYDISLTTSDGRMLSPLRGELNLVLAPYTLWKNRPNVRATHFRTNAEGFRGPELADRSDGRRRMIMTGASATFGIGLEADSETIPAALEAGAEGLEVVNAGVVLFQSGQELAYLATELIKHRPDVVVAYDGWADAFDGLYDRSRGGVRHGYNALVAGALEEMLAAGASSHAGVGESASRFWTALLESSRVVTEVRRRLAPPPAAARGVTGMVARGERTESMPAPDFDAALSEYVDNIISMRDVCAGRGVRFVVAFQPELGQKTARSSEEEAMLRRGLGDITTYAAEFSPHYRRFLDRAVTLLEGARVQCVDVSKDARFSQAPETLFCDVVHTNGTGNRVIAQILRGILAERR